MCDRKHRSRLSLALIRSLGENNLTGTRARSSGFPDDDAVAVCSGQGEFSAVRATGDIADVQG